MHFSPSLKIEIFETYRKYVLIAEKLFRTLKNGVSTQLYINMNKIQKEGGTWQRLKSIQYRRNAGF